MNPADQQRRMLEMQHKIRNDAQQQQHYLGEFADWNRDIAKKDKERRDKPADLPPVRGGMRVGVRNSNAKADAGASKHRQQSAKAPGAHVYDKGYKKWEQFDADNYDVDEAATVAVEEDAVDATGMTRVPADARPLAEPENPEEAQRRLGNEKFAKGDYEGAVRSYSLCLGLKARNHVALSNRAMAYLKQNQYNNAEADCDTALTYEPDHFKSLQRRATARHALGKHRAAAQDVMRALRIEPSSKALLAQQQRILAALRSAAADAPFVSVRAAEAA